MKKVLFTSHLANFAKFNKPFMKWFQEQNWEVHYASLDEEAIPYCDKHFKVSFNRSPYSFDNIRAYGQLKEIINQERYDIIHCHTPMGGVVTRLAAVKARTYGTKVIYTAHGFHFYHGAPLKNWLLYYPVEKFLSRYIDCLITINAEDYRTANNRRFKTGYIEKIDGVGVDLTRFHPVDVEQKAILRKEYGFGSDDLILICVAEFIARKNHVFIIETIAKLMVDMPNIKVIFAGVGELLETCKVLSDKLNMHGQIFFMGYRCDVEKLYAISDILISASKQEGLPINIIEGMACGLPVVCTNIRGQIDVIKQDENGFLYDLSNEKGFCDEIKKLYTCSWLREKIASKNVLDVQRYSIELAIDNMARVYEKYA